MQDEEEEEEQEEEEEAAREGEGDFLTSGTGPWHSPHFRIISVSGQVTGYQCLICEESKSKKKTSGKGLLSYQGGSSSNRIRHLKSHKIFAPAAAVPDANAQAPAARAGAPSPRAPPPPGM
jgi:hypothetical protein